MRVAHFIETDIAGGAESVMLGLCRYAACRDIDVVVIHFGNDWISEQCSRHGISELIAPYRRLFKSTSTLPFFALGFGAFLLRHGVDVLHSHLFGPVTAAALAAALFRIPHVGTLHDIHMLEDKSSRWILVKAAELLGTRLVTVSRHMASFYLSRARLRSDRVSTIYNGISANSPPLESTAMRASFTADPECKVLVCVGRLVPLKRVDSVIEAFARASQATAALLIVVGEGPELERLRHIARALSANVLFLGYRCDVDVILAASDVFVQFSETEGLSMSIAEAMASGLPCIVSEVGGNSELVIQGQGGWVLPPQDIAGLESAIAAFVGDPEFLEKKAVMGSFNRFRISSVFDAESNYEQYLNVYASIARRGR